MPHCDFVTTFIYPSACWFCSWALSWVDGWEMRGLGQVKCDGSMGRRAERPLVGQRGRKRGVVQVIKNVQSSLHTPFKRGFDFDD
jgi:hypothetical protein